LREKNDENWRYDAEDSEYKDVVKARIIDLTKVVRTALQSTRRFLRRSRSPPRPGKAPEFRGLLG
jgi:hypothetical protein